MSDSIGMVDFFYLNIEFALDIFIVIILCVTRKYDLLIYASTSLHALITNNCNRGSHAHPLNNP